MPNHLEYVVRPSQLTNIRPGTPTQILATPKVIDNQPIVFGGGGDSIFDLNASESVTLPQAKFEESRTYDVVRVYNPDDKTQFVDTEQMTEYQARNKPSQQSKIADDRIQLKFATNTNTENTEVIEKGKKRNTNFYINQ
jgi:hypothetical protein